MLRALGMQGDDFTKPQIGIASSYNTITPCNMSLREVAENVAVGVRSNGGFPM
jgi:dihydroxy-acid dehydratase